MVVSPTALHKTVIALASLVKCGSNSDLCYQSIVANPTQVIIGYTTGVGGADIRSVNYSIRVFPEYRPIVKLHSVKSLLFRSLVHF